jgi:hypothetical protein
MINCNCRADAAVEHDIAAAESNFRRALVFYVVLVAAHLDFITGTIDKLLGGTDMMIPRVILL